VNRAWILFSAVLTLALGCSQAVMLDRESDHGGVVTYSYKQDRGGPMGSRYRMEALDVIKAKCKTGSHIVREGDVKGYTSAGMGIIEGTEDEERGRRWGIQFECKDAPFNNQPERP
jgi:hypothetical protein